MNKLRDLFLSQKGSVALYTVLVFSIVFPILLFVAVDLPYTVNVHRKLKDTLDNAGGSAILCYVEEELAYGRITIDETCAQHVIKKLLATDFKLNPDTLEPLEHSPFFTTPKLVIRVVNQPNGPQRIRLPEEHLSDDEKFQDIYVEKTSVVIYVETQLNTLFFKQFHPLVKQASSTQSQFGSLALPED